CTLVASELVRDRDTVQMGVGTVSAALGLYLGEKHDIGIQTELITGGIAQLVYDGVVTGKYKTLHREKVVGSALVALTDEEMRMIDGNPAFELYDFGYTDDVRMLVQHDNLVAVNNALLVDLTGQIASESIGSSVWTGVGGQTAFMIAAQYSRGGRGIIVLPSSHVINGERVTRIVPLLPEGTLVTVPRTLVDYVVTEHGIATLRGKTVRERIGELIGIAHPDFKAELKRAAREYYGITV
ncbi:MAG: acetyl-CoA hydrolase/transferase C-terminal domain-containing protein, partial [Vicinamibacterales bacterium]